MNVENGVTMVELNTSNLCNLRCLTCVRSAPEFQQPRPIRLSLAQFDVILSRFPGLEKLQICGFSEPTLNRDVPEMISHAKIAGIPHVEMFTNATILNGDIAKRLATSGLDLLRVSIDGGDSETYRRVRGANLAKVTSNIRNFTEMSGVPVQMEAVLSRYTMESALGFPDIASALGARSLAIRLLDGQDSNLTQDLIYDPTYLKGLKQELAILCQKLGIELVMPLPGEQDFPSQCTVWSEVYVNERGELQPCCLLKDRVVGNLLQSTFEEIRDKQQAALLAEREQNGGFLDECCCNMSLLIQGKVQDFAS